jgi:hypothetical protein
MNQNEMILMPDYAPARFGGTQVASFEQFAPVSGATITEVLTFDDRYALHISILRFVVQPLFAFRFR